MTEKPHPDQTETALAGGKLEASHYHAQAADVLLTFRGGENPKDGYREARQAYVVEERENGDPRLADLAETLLDAPLVLPIQQELDRAHAERDFDTVDRLKPVVIRFNHELRDLIADTPPGMFTREELTGWLREAARDMSGDATKRMMNGIVAEVAVAKRLRADPDVESVRFATPAEEEQNVDVVAVLKPKPGKPPETRRLQVKCGRHRLDEPVVPHPNGVVEVGFTADVFQGFGFAKEHRAAASDQLHRALELGFASRPRPRK